MKNIVKILYVFWILLLTNCQSRSNIANIGLTESNENTITVDVRTPNPEYSAMYQLLFRGIAESSQQTPLITVNELAATNRNPAYFDNFFRNGRYKTFITSSTKNPDSSYRIVINLRALKLDLDYNAITRKFGY